MKGKMLLLVAFLIICFNLRTGFDSPDPLLGTIEKDMGLSLENSGLFALLPVFVLGVAARRCVVPATGFYEWDADKRRYLFRMPARTELYMAALYGVFGGEARYCILTTQANASVAPVHHRMPLVLRAQEVRPWLEDEQTARRLLHETPPELERRETDGQLRLW